MGNLADLIRKTERMREQVETLSRELDTLRTDLVQMNGGKNGQSDAGVAPETDCFAVAFTIGQNLGPEFSSDRPHDSADRGAGWFDTP